MDDEQAAFLWGLSGGVIVALVLTLIYHDIWIQTHVEAGDQFIYKKATYKCEKTNELIEGEHGNE